MRHGWHECFVRKTWPRVDAADLEVVILDGSSVRTQLLAALLQKTLPLQDVVRSAACCAVLLLFAISSLMRPGCNEIVIDDSVSFPPVFVAHI